MHQSVQVLTESPRMAEGFAVAGEPAVLARVPLCPAEPGPAEGQEDAVLAEALFLASRQGGAAAGLAAGDGPEARPVPSRGDVTRRAYALRSRWRPTPHGAFAGVAVVRVAGPAERASLLLGPSHRPRTIPSGRWLAELEGRLLEETELLGRLRLAASNLVAQRGERLEHRHLGRRSTIRATEASLRVMQLCADEMTGAEVVSALLRRWPARGEDACNVVEEMARGGFVSTDLLPADVTCDPLKHLLGKLPPGHRLDPPLRRLRDLLAAADEHPVGSASRLAALTGARDIADEICPVSRPLTLDVAADADIAVPASLLDEAARSATALGRAVARPAVLAGWHERFVERYGPNRLVPLLEATDAAAGLGIAADDIEDMAAAARDDNRERVMAALIAAAIADGCREVLLDRHVLARLADGRDSPPPRSAEIAVRVIASSQRDLAVGRLQLAVVPPGPQEAGSTIGRFASLLPGAWPGPPPTAPGALVAEIAAQPAVPEGAGLAPPAGFAAIRIPVGVPARPADLNLADLHLFSDGSRLFCWSVRLGREIVPVLYSRLAPALLPPIARFLQLLGRTAGPMLSGWSWGPLAAWPFQPRVRYGRVILAPARWLLPESLVSAAGNPGPWGAALDRWRAGAAPRLPRVVVTDNGDRRLPLDLTRADDRELLRRYVRRGLTAVCEQPGGPDAVQAVAQGPGGRHVLELVIPLKPAAPAPAPAPARPCLTPRAFDEGLVLPGGPWLSIHLCSPPACHDQILGQLETLRRDLAGQFELCFWLRYADAAHGHHLRIRFCGDPAALGGTVLPAVSHWCAGLRRQRLAGAFSVEPYDQEIERYGGRDAITAAERVFAADSHLAGALLAPGADPAGRLVSAAVSIAAITTAVCDGDPAALPGRHLGRDARRRYEQSRPAARLAAPPGDLAAFSPEAIPGAAAGAWQARHETLTAYRAQLEPGRRARCSAALAHMHANRLLADTVAERIATALAADLLARRAAETQP